MALQCYTTTRTSLYDDDVDDDDDDDDDDGDNHNGVVNGSMSGWMVDRVHIII